LKSGTPKNGANRDRPYYGQSPAALGRIEAHIEEITGDEPVASPPQTMREELGRKALRHRPALAAGIGAIAVLVAVVILGPGLRSGATAQPTASSSAGASAVPTSTPAGIAQATETSLLPSPSEVPTSSPTPWPTLASIWTPAPTPVPTPTPVQAWPVALDDSTDYSSGEMVVGPDGTIYIPGIAALDSKGHSRGGWLLLPDGHYATPVAFGTDGTIYATDQTDDTSDSADNTAVYAFGANGKAIAGWPVSLDIGDDPTFEAGPSGSLYVFGDGGDSYTAIVLTPAGKATAKWNVGSDGGGDCGQVVRPDGTVFYAYSSTDSMDDCEIDVFGPTGSRLSKSPVRDWNDLTMAPDGTVVAVGYDMEPYSSSVVAETRVAVIGTDGQPAAGWPIVFQGAASDPAFGPDGTVYVAIAGVGTTASSVIGYDVSGVAEPGWPVSLPAGLGPFAGDDESGTPLPPVVGTDGTVYLAATKSDWTGSVLAFDPSGNVLPGWPYKLPQAFAAVGDGRDTWNPGPMFVRSTSGGGAIYLALDGEAIAVGHDGKVVAGWPYVLTDDDDSWEDWATVPDGGLIVIIQTLTDQGDTIDLVVRFTPAGKLVR
jgi:hypothetical protein